MSKMNMRKKREKELISINLMRNSKDMFRLLKV
jgi:hypothetical protein